MNVRNVLRVETTHSLAGDRLSVYEIGNNLIVIDSFTLPSGVAVRHVEFFICV